MGRFGYAFAAYAQDISGTLVREIKLVRIAPIPS